MWKDLKQFRFNPLSTGGGVCDRGICVSMYLMGSEGIGGSFFVHRSWEETLMEGYLYVKEWYGYVGYFPGEGEEEKVVVSLRGLFRACLDHGATGEIYLLWTEAIIRVW